MPAVTFFEMLKCSRLIEAHEKLEACNLFYIPGADFKWYELMRNTYRDRIESVARPVEIPQVKDQSIVYQSGTQDAHHAMQRVFAQARRTVH